MSKRFTDTDKWKKRWFNELGSKLRDVRQFILDDCDAAGIWEINLIRISNYIGEPITIRDIERALNHEFLTLDGDSVFIPAFIRFQYGNLSRSSKPHLSAISKLEKKGIDPVSLEFKGLGKGWDTLKDKDKEEDKEKDKDMDKDKEEDKEKDKDMDKEKEEDKEEEYGAVRDFNAIQQILKRARK